MAKAWIEDYIAAWNSHDPDRIVSFMEDDTVYEDFALGVRLVGREAIKSFIRETEEHFSTDFRFELTNALASDSGYAAEWTMRGTNDRADTLRGLPATGKPYNIRG